MILHFHKKTFIALVFFAVISALAIAHPGHFEDASPGTAPAFFLAQTGPAAGRTPRVHRLQMVW